ncbi:hypothetical protein [Porphyromonas somerae]|uniref:hypothetical protein n=1 Tax=Porphyromonas somerae TaxID=322095 RepID=UPI001FCBC6F4|nr:hypothetical protein [Porphyromonas somerae]BDE81806.1 hypothetical protein CE91St14_08340 [Porphyromonas somerae]
MNDKTVKVQWDNGGGNELQGIIKFDKYFFNVGLNLLDEPSYLGFNDMEDRSVLVFIHCADPTYEEVYEGAFDSLATALNWLQEMTEDEIVRLTNKAIENCKEEKTMDDKNVKVQWDNGGGNDLDGSLLVEGYKVLVGLLTYGVDEVWMSDAEKRKVVLFLHCVEPAYYEIYEDVHNSLADALNWLQELKESEVIEMIEKEKEYCNR